MAGVTPFFAPICTSVAGGRPALGEIFLEWDAMGSYASSMQIRPTCFHRLWLYSNESQGHPIVQFRPTVRYALKDYAPATFFQDITRILCHEGSLRAPEV